ncbi:hypothetical protein INE66_003639 [Salmonella enterica subsp. enterica]|nr:hypothetical protein [Salmonella enterica subsp. enterica]
MPVTRVFREAGEATASIPLYLCQQTREALPEMWGRLPVEAMREELRQDIEPRDRFEYLVSDDAGTIKAMMVIALDYNPHYGSYLAPLYAFSTEKGALSGAWRWMKQLAKCMKCDNYLITRQISGNEITTRKISVAQQT